MQTLDVVLSAFRDKRVLIVGDVILDEYIWGDVRRISPEAPVPVVEIRSRTYVPGGAANVAANVAALGGQALLGGVVGPDGAGQKLCEALRLSMVNAAGIIVDQARPTTTKTRIVAHSQQVVRADHEHRGPLAPAIEEALLDWTQNHLSTADVCVLSDYAKGVVSPRLARQVIESCQASGKPVIVDPKGSSFAKYQGATVVKPNAHEAEQFVKHEIHDEVSLVETGQRLVEMLAGTAVLITRGQKGMSLFRRDQPPFHVAAEARNVFDVTGAGDTVVGTLALCLTVPLDLSMAVRIANLAAGIAVTKVGTATLTPRELLTHAADVGSDEGLGIVRDG
jgi:D-beta-D-heptose 7-phosphate kinase/D-beta-D-heptose 1-phosphate adenosyltransferase